MECASGVPCLQSRTCSFAESLASFIRASFVVSQYADDITIVVSDNARFNGVDECLTVFQRGPGLVSIVQSPRDCGWDLGPLALTHNSVLSGILMQSSVSVCGSVLLGYARKIGEMQLASSTVCCSAMSFAGRVTVVKRFAAAKMWHVAQVPPPPGVVADIVRNCWSFIWHNMRTLVRRPVCTLPTTARGLGALDFDFEVASLHIQWMRILPLDDPSKWRHFAKFWLDRVASPFGWEEVLAGLNVSVSGWPECVGIWYTSFL